MRNFIVQCMESIGTKKEHAEALAEVLVSADYRGHYSHGLNRLDMYVDEIKIGVTSHEEPKILKETAATAWVDGSNALGPVVGKFCMDLAIKKAKEAGVGWISVKGSNHFGIAGWYSMKAAEQGFVGMAFTNTGPWVVPTRSREKALGTNPISVAAPCKDGQDFVLDMATSTVAQGKVELSHRKEVPIPSGWGCDASGKETHDPGLLLKEGGLFPLGGLEQSGGYKGYGLSMMVEVFCGILGGATYGPNVRRWQTEPATANLGQCFVAVNPNCFAPGFEDRMTDLSNTCRNLPKAEGETEILVAGDPERKHMKKCDDLGGIPYHPNQIEYLKTMAKNLNVPLPVIITAKK